jgi:spore protease
MYGYFSERSYSGDLPYTDLALERHRADLEIPGVEFSRESRPLGCWERIRICTKRAAEAIGRPLGLYHTLNLPRFDRLSSDRLDDAKNEISNELCRIFDESDIFPGRILVVGLGNRELTPDAIGTESARIVKPTMHIKEHDRSAFSRLDCAEIAVITPGVGTDCGLDAAVSVKGLCDLIRPDAVIAIDALAARSAERLGSTIQICNSGISPGSGIGNPRLAVSIETVGVPVVAIGVPTVIDSRVLSGTESLYEPMFVSPKEIGEIVSCTAEIIGGGINRAFGIWV